MAHYAKVLNGKVTKVVVADEFSNLVDGTAGKWIQTSYNTKGGIHYDPNTGKPSGDQSKAIRYNYAGVGHSYDKVNDAFIPPKPYDSWLLNTETYTWEAPIAEPEDNNTYRWVEDSGQWEITGLNAKIS